MHLVNFTFDGITLSDFGCIIASIVTSNNDSISLGSDLSFETIRNTSTFSDKLVAINYDNPEPIKFDICKNPCGENMNFTDAEISYLMKWLNKKAYKKFRPIYDDGSYSDIYFNGYFNVSAIYIGSNVVGFTLTFIQDSPFGYDTEKELNINISRANDMFTFYNNSDEEGYLYPSLFQVACASDGNLIITDNLDARNIVRVNNCVYGEIITFDCVNKVIQSNKSHPTLPNDFNYNFPRFISNESNSENIITVSLPCDISFKYSFIRKAGIIVW